jgi:hypothetical protein
LANLDANLELKLNASEDLDVKLAALLQDIGRNTSWGQVGLSRFELRNKIGNLVVQVLDLSFNQDKELEVNTNLLLVVILGLQLVGQVSIVGKSSLQARDKLRSNVRLLQFVLEIGSVL